MVAGPSIAQILNRAQETSAGHAKCVADLVALRSSVPDFTKTLISYLNRVLPVAKREPTVDRVLAFTFRFVKEVVSVDAELPFVLLEYFLQRCSCKDKGVRFRAVQFVGGILDNLGDDAEVPENIWGLLNTVMLDRLYDKVPAVRVAAVHAAARLQDPSNKNCPVIASLSDLLQNDAVKDVRKTVLTRLALCKRTMPVVLQRVRDVSDDVRKQAFVTLGQQVKVNSFSIAQRVYLLTHGLRDANAGVKQACLDMLHKAWLLNACEGSLSKLLSLLHVVENEECGALVCSHEIDRGTSHVHQVKCDGVESMSPEECLMLRCAIDMWVKKDAHEKVDHTVPDVIALVEAVKKAVVHFAEQEEEDAQDDEEQDDAQEEAKQIRADARQFCTRQLLRTMMAVLDFAGDETQRRAVASVTEAMIADVRTPQSCLSDMMDVLVVAVPDLHERIAATSTLVHDILEPLSTDHAAQQHMERLAAQREIQQLSNRIVYLQDQEKDAGSSKKKADSEELAQLKRRVKALKAQHEEDEESEDEKEELTLRSVLITRSLLQGIDDARVSSSVLEGLVASVVPTALRSPLADTRNAALHALGLYCLFNERIMLENVPLFVSVLETASEELAVRGTALKSLFDFCFKFASSCPTIMTETRLKVFCSLLDVEKTDIELVVIATQGLCKLVLYNRVSSVAVLSRMIRLYFEPSVKNRDDIRRCLSLFFPAYAFSSEERQALIGQCMVPLARMWSQLPMDHDLRDVEFSDVSAFVLYLSDSRELQEKSKATGKNTHEDVAMAVLDDALQNAGKTCVGWYVRVLCRLNLNAGGGISQEWARVVSALARDLAKSKNYVSVERLTKLAFDKWVKSIARVAGEDVGSDDDEEDEATVVEEPVKGKTVQKRTLRKQKVAVEEEEEEEEEDIVDQDAETEQDVETDNGDSIEEECDLDDDADEVSSQTSEKPAILAHVDNLLKDSESEVDDVDDDIVRQVDALLADDEPVQVKKAAKKAAPAKSKTTTVKKKATKPKAASKTKNVKQVEDEEEACVDRVEKKKAKAPAAAAARSKAKAPETSARAKAIAQIDALLTDDE